MWLFIEATDVWLFRDGRPFDAGSDHRAASIFPPEPTTIQGAIRSKLLALYDADFTAYAAGGGVSDEVVKQIGAAVAPQKGTMRLRGPFLARRLNDDDRQIMPYFPTPADLLQINTDKRRLLVPLKPEPAPAFSSNWPDETPGLRPCTYDEALAGDDDPGGSRTWISAVGFDAYLNGKISTNNFLPSAGLSREARQAWIQEAEAKLNAAGELGHVHLKSAGAFFGSEYRLGIGIDGEHKRPSDGKLYTAAFIRPRQNVGLLVEVTGLDEDKWPSTGVLSLGGERKAARYTRIEKPLHWPSNVTDGNKLVFVTPTYFDDGWLPKNWGSYFTNADLTAALVGRAKQIGGWNMAGNRPKPMRRYVPETAVYFFARPLQSKNNTGTANGAICDDEDAGRIGFGVTFIGRQ